MKAKQTRLFHLHYQVPDVSHAEAHLAERGLPLHRRYGRVDGRSRSLREDDPVPDGFRLRLQDAQRGAANVTIAPGPRLEFDHFGLVTSDFERALERARDAGWYVNEGDHRTFFHTPWRFRVEVHPVGGDVASSLGSRTDARFGSVVLSVPAPDSVRSGLTEVLDVVPSLSIERARTDHPMVTRATIVGSAVPDGRSIHATDLATAEE